MPNPAFDPQLLVRGTEADIARLRQLNATSFGQKSLQEGLSAFLSAFLDNQNHEDENIYYAGVFLKRAGVSDGDAWANSWIRDLSPEAHHEAGLILVAFLHGFYGDRARKALMQMAAKLETLKPATRLGGAEQAAMAASVDDMFDRVLGERAAFGEDLLLRSGKE